MSTEEDFISRLTKKGCNFLKFKKQKPAIFWHICLKTKRLINYQNLSASWPWGSVHRRAVSRWPVCKGSPPGSRHPPRAHRTSCPETAPGQRRAGSRRMCPACSPKWTHYWSQSQLFWCSCLRPTAGSPPADTGNPSVGERGKQMWWREQENVEENKEKKVDKKERLLICWDFFPLYNKWQETKHILNIFFVCWIKFRA